MSKKVFLSRKISKFFLILTIFFMPNGAGMHLYIMFVHLSCVLGMSHANFFKLGKVKAFWLKLPFLRFFAFLHFAFFCVLLRFWACRWWSCATTACYKCESYCFHRSSVSFAHPMHFTSLNTLGACWRYAAEKFLFVNNAPPIARKIPKRQKKEVPTIGACL